MNLFIESLEGSIYSVLRESFRGLYSDEEGPLRDRLEFSSRFGRNIQHDLRFGLFKIYEPERIEMLFKKLGYSISDLVESFDIMGKNTPEFAFGYHGGDNPRLKVYYLRLPDKSGFKEKCGGLVRKLMRCSSEELKETGGIDLTKCYLIGEDYNPDGIIGVKIYIHEDGELSLGQVEKEVGRNGFGRSYVKDFFDFDLTDVTYSYRLLTNSDNHHKKLSGFAFFIEPCNNQNEKIEKLINKKSGKNFFNFKKRLQLIEKGDNPAIFSQLGLTFSKENPQGVMTVYYSPTIGVKK